MGNTLLTLGPIQSIGIALAGIGLTAVTFILLFRQGEVITLEASDGTKFRTEEARNSYEALLQKLKPIYEEDELKVNKDFGFKEGFLGLLKSNGFSDLKTLLTFRDDIQKLVELLENK